MLGEHTRRPRCRKLLVVTLAFASFNTLFIFWVYFAHSLSTSSASLHSPSAASADNGHFAIVEGAAFPIPFGPEAKPEADSSTNSPSRNARRKPPNNGPAAPLIDSATNDAAAKEAQARLPKWIRDYIDYHRSTDTADTRYLVWICDKTVLCGGIGDRARGIVTSFYLALVTGRKLLLHNPDPVDMTDILVPASIDWSRNATNVAAEATWEYGSLDHINGALFDFVNGRIPQHRVVSVRSNYIIWPTIMNDHRLSDVRLQRQIPDGDSSSQWNEMLFYWAWKALMLPSEALLQDIKALRHQSGIANEGFVAIHIRRGGHWGDPLRYHDTNLLASFSECLKNMTTITGQFPVYVTSDDFASKQEFAKLVPGQIVFDNTTMPFHVERTEREEGFIERNRRAWAEYYLLSLSKCTIACGSGFSIWPVAMSRHPAKGSRCFARLERCSLLDIERSMQGFVPVRI